MSPDPSPPEPTAPLGGRPPVVPGEILLADGDVALAGSVALELEVTNSGDRPIQVGSHYHFAEANPALRFERGAARGMRLAIPSGTSVRFEPGIARRVALMPHAGRRRVLGLRGEVAGPLDTAPRSEAPDPAADGRPRR